MHYKATDPLDLDVALKRILDQVAAPAATETVPVREARGRVAAETIRSGTDLPPFPASAMDGYAFRWRPGIDSLEVTGESLAGHPFAGTVSEGQCVRIMTGAPLPAHCDTVIVQEDCGREGATLRLRAPPEPGANVRQVGDDLRRGDAVAAAGKRLSPFDIGSLAASGCATATVRTRPRVAIFSTGDELQQPGTALEFGNIYDSNRFAVEAMLARLPVEVDNLGVLADDAAVVAASLTAASANSALILTSGGVSVGDADHVKNTVEALGELG
ncbi:MAG: molybdopterin molybdotransferase MoeA, partial [Rhodospirillales bacterium]|nr:molybdopterin molybdotransferase MoeA [Rhodospirillales bacterium]